MFLFWSSTLEFFFEASYEINDVAGQMSITPIYVSFSQALQIPLHIIVPFYLFLLLIVFFEKILFSTCI